MSSLNSSIQKCETTDTDYPTLSITAALLAYDLNDDVIEVQQFIKRKAVLSSRKLISKHDVKYLDKCLNYYLNCSNLNELSAIIRPERMTYWTAEMETEANEMAIEVKEEELQTEGRREALLLAFDLMDGNITHDEFLSRRASLYNVNILNSDQVQYLDEFQHHFSRGLAREFLSFTPRPTPVEN